MHAAKCNEVRALTLNQGLHLHACVMTSCDRHMTCMQKAQKAHFHKPLPVHRMLDGCFVNHTERLCGGMFKRQVLMVHMAAFHLDHAALPVAGEVRGV